MSDPFHDPRGDARFLTTRWSVVLEAGALEEPRRRAALEELCRAYWYPLYAYVRRSGSAAGDAADLTQEFFARLLAREDLRRADRSRGRFRSYLLAALKHFLANEREKALAQKRGGGQATFAIDAHAADTRFAREPADARTPELSFRRAWAESALAAALVRLRAEQERVGRAAHFDALRSALASEDDAPPQSEVAASLGLSANAVKVALHRLRKRFGELVRDEVAGTLERPEEIEDELCELFDAFARST